MNDRFDSTLLPDEQVLWSGQPDPKALLTVADIFLIPFSLLWGGMAIFMFAQVLLESLNGTHPAPLIFHLVALFFLLIAIYFIAGRFALKAWVKRRTFYAVTDRRILILSEALGSRLQAVFIDTLPLVEKSVGRTGRGTVVFGTAPFFTGLYRNTGLDLFGGGLRQQVPAFYDIPDAEQVAALVMRLRIGKK